MNFFKLYFEKKVYTIFCLDNSYELKKTTTFQRTKYLFLLIIAFSPGIFSVSVIIKHFTHVRWNIFGR